MYNLLELATQIKDIVTMQDVVHKYGFTLNRNNFMSCPLHREKTASLKIHTKYWKCYGCLEGGTVIDFVMKLFSLSLEQTIVRMDNDFNLRLPLNKKLTLREKREYQLKEKERRDKLEYKSACKKARMMYFVYLCNKLHEYERIKQNNAPSNEFDEWSNMFVDALQNAARTEHLIDNIDWR